MHFFPRMCPGLLVPYTSFSLSVPFPRAFLSYTLLSLYFFFPCFFPCRFSFPISKQKTPRAGSYPGRGIFSAVLKRYVTRPQAPPVLPGAANIAAVVRTVKMDFFDGVVRFLQRFV